jgi:hypothetical protein
MKSKSRYFISTNFKFSDRSKCTLQYWVSPVLQCFSCYCNSQQQIVSAVYVTRSNFSQQIFQIDHHRTTKFWSSIWILLPSYRQDAPLILKRYEILFRKNRRHSIVASLSRIRILLAWRQVGIKDKSFYYSGIRISLYSVVGTVGSRNCVSIPRTVALRHTQPHNQRIKNPISSKVKWLDMHLTSHLQMVRKLRMCGSIPTPPYIPSCGAPGQFYCGSSEQCKKHGSLSAVA